MVINKNYSHFLKKPPRKTNECWLGDKNEKIYVYGYKFLLLLEGTSLQIWQLLDGKYSVEEIINKISEDYDSFFQERISEDIIDFLLQLEKIGLLAWRTRPLFEEVNIF